jgi:hypothetical protein
MKANTGKVVQLNFLLCLLVFLVNDGKKSYIIEAGMEALFKYV